MKNNLVKKAGVFLSGAGLSALLLTGGCTTTGNAIIGGLVGAGTGAIIGHQSGETGEGAAIGAAVGAIGGAILGEESETTYNTNKYCPTGGEIFGGDINYCPKHGTQLRYRTP